MRKKLAGLGLCGVVCLLVGAVAVETVEWVQENKIISTTSDIFNVYLEARNDFPPLPLPMGVDDLISRMEEDDWSFLNDHWYIDQCGSTLYISKDSKMAKQFELPLQILVMEDIRMGSVTIYCEDEKGQWEGLALFDAPLIIDETDPLYAARSAEEKKQNLFWNLTETRIRWTATLKPESDMLADFVFQRDTAAELASLLEEDGAMAMMSVPPEHTNDIWISCEPVSNGFDLAVYCPSGVNNVEIYVSDDLVSNVWRVAVSSLSAVNTNKVYWTASTEEVGFYRAGNMDVDSDEDGVPDARETFVLKTEVNDPDSDGDGYSDGPIWPSGYTNVMRGTNDLFPNDPSAWRDTDGDGQPNEVVGMSSSTPPLVEDLDDDGDGTNDFLFSSIWISASEISGLATNTAQWTNLVEVADQPLFDLDISDQDNNANVYTMAKALVYARTGIESYRTDVIDACMDAIGTEAGGESLALGRNLGAFVIAAELVGLPWAEEMQFRDWLLVVRTNIMTAGRSLITCHEQRPNNWGTMAGGSRAAVAVYLQDWDDLADTAQVFKGYLGDTNSYNSFSFGELWWQAGTNNPVGVNPTNGTIQGHSVDGVLPEEMRRATEPDGDPAEFTWPPPYQNYVYEALQGALLQGVILNRAGYDVWNWEDQAILRAFTWKHDVAGYPPVGDDNWQPFIINYYYDTSFATTNLSRHGKNVAPTCWTHQSIP